MILRNPLNTTASGAKLFGGLLIGDIYVAILGGMTRLFRRNCCKTGGWREYREGLQNPHRW